MTTRLLLVITYVHGLSARLPNTYAPHHELRNAIVEAAAAAEAIDHILEFSIAERANLMALRGRVRPRSARARAPPPSPNQAQMHRAVRDVSTLTYLCPSHGAAYYSTSVGTRHLTDMHNHV